MIAYVVTRAQLEALAALVPDPPKATPRPGHTHYPPFDLAQWIASHALSVVSQGPWSNGGARWVLNPCPWNPVHTNRSAFIVQLASGAIAAGCHHNSCSGNDWPALRDLFEPGWGAYRDNPPQFHASGYSVNGQAPQLSTSTPLLDASAPWPQLGEEAYYGLAGKIVRTIEPHTESDPVALLMQSLVMVGSVIGRTPYFPVEADYHYPNLFAAIVGESSRGRKGTSAGHPRRLLTSLDPAWSARIMGGLSSGEGVIWNVRDAVYGQNKKGEEVCLDEGVEDKRLCILETEFARALAKTGQEGNVLSAVLRQAWDHGDLRTLVSGRQKSPVTATNPHICLIAHITVEELRRLLTETEAANGFANRFLWLCVRRAKLLPDGGMYPERELRPLTGELQVAIQHARTVARMQRSPAAQGRWRELYSVLAEGQPGLLGAITARAEAQVLRLSCLYALLDKTDIVDIPHLDAAYALWRYCEESARYIFGELLGDPLADELHRMLRQIAPEGMTRTDISNALGRNYKSAAIGQALARLHRDGFACATVHKTAGRPVETWYASVPRVSSMHEKNELNEISLLSTELDSEDITLHSLNSFNSCCVHPRTTRQATGQVVCLDCGELAEGSATTSVFAGLTASTLWCHRCKRDVPFRTVVQLDGTQRYVCVTCDSDLGSKPTTAPPGTNGTHVPDDVLLEGTPLSEAEEDPWPEPPDDPLTSEEGVDLVAAEPCPRCRCVNLMVLGEYRKCPLCLWKGKVKGQ